MAIFNTRHLHYAKLRPVLRSLTHEAARTLIQAFISSRLDYCNSLLYGVSDNLIPKSSVCPERRDNAIISSRFCGSCIGFLSRDTHSATAASRLASFDSLPAHLRDEDIMHNSFRRELKTFFVLMLFPYGNSRL